MNKLLVFSFVALTSMSAFAGGGTVDSDLLDTCNGQVYTTKNLVKADGTVDNEAEFAKDAALTLQVCTQSADNWASVSQALKKAKKGCDEAADQGMSSLFRGTCYLKAAEFATFVLGQ